MTPQHMDALAKANEWRMKQAGLFRQLGAKQVLLSEVLCDLPDYMVNVPIGRLLKAQRGWAGVKTTKFLEDHGEGARYSTQLGDIRYERLLRIAGQLKEKGW